jgi:hypothetical protein
MALDFNVNRQPPKTPEEISEVLKRISMPERSFNSCFCGKDYECRNLCPKHYQWVWKHHFI